MAYNKSHVCRIITASNWENNYLQTLHSWEKWKLLSCVRLFVTPWTIVHGILQTRILVWVAGPFSRGSSQPRDRTQVSCIAGEFFTSWATRGKFKNTGVGSLSLQGIFPIQELNQGLHCRWFLYQLSYQGSPQFWKRFPEDRLVSILYPVHPPSKSWLHIYYRPLKCFCG